MKTLVSTLAGDVGSIRTNIATVLDLRRSLQDPAGNPIDIGQVRNDVANLKVLAANLNGPTASPFVCAISRRGSRRSPTWRGPRAPAD